MEVNFNRQQQVIASTWAAHLNVANDGLICPPNDDRWDTFSLLKSRFILNLERIQDVSIPAKVVVTSHVYQIGRGSFEAINGVDVLSLTGSEFENNRSATYC